MINRYSNNNTKGFDFEEIVRIVLDRRVSGRPVDPLDVAMARNEVEAAMHSIITENELISDLIVRLRLCGMCERMRGRWVGGCR